MSVRVSVAVCTWNRAALLEGTLTTMCALDVPEGLEWEVVVVDNGSTDATPEVVERLGERLPVRRVLEPEPGHSNARNRAVHEARGAYIVWTDDDVLVHPGWLAAYARAFSDFPDVAFFGGAVLPHFTEEPPAWVRAAWPRIEALFAVRSPPASGAEVERTYLPFGANFAVRTDVQRRHPYNPELGRTRGGLDGLDELAVMVGMLEDGDVGRWVPDAVLEHVITPDRFDARHLGGLIEAQAGLEVDALPVRGRVTVFGAPLWLWKKWLFAEAVDWVARHTSDGVSRYEALHERSLRRGQLRSLRRGGPPAEAVRVQRASVVPGE